MTTSTLNVTEKMEGFFASKVFTILPAEVDQLLRKTFNSNIIDVREPKDFIQGHLPGAINLPEHTWGKIKRLRNSQTTIVYCYSQTCPLAVQAMLEFSRRGYPVLEMEGGFEAWKEASLPVEA